MSRKSSILITISWKNPFILTAQFFDFFACFLRHQIPKNELFMKKMQPLIKSYLRILFEKKNTVDNRPYSKIVHTTLAHVGNRVIISSYVVLESILN